MKPVIIYRITQYILQYQHVATEATGCSI